MEHHWSQSVRVKARDEGMFALSERACSGQVAEQAAKPHGCQHHQNTLEVMLSRIPRQFFN